MAKTVYIGVGGVARKAKKVYVGVSGVAHKVKKAYVGVGGVARLCYSSAPDDPAYTGGYTIVTSGNYRYMYLTTSGTLTIKDDAAYDFWGIGGGSSGSAHSGTYYWGPGGGSSGYTVVVNNKTLVSGNTVPVTVGLGGSAVTQSNNNRTGIRGNAGGATTFGVLGTTYTAAGGKNTYRNATNMPSSSKDYGMDGGTGSPSGWDNGNTTAHVAGSSDGANGGGTFGGYGQQSTTKAFAESTNTLYGGSGAATNTGAGGGTTPGGSGGGGASAAVSWSSATATAGAANTGSGGGAVHSYATDTFAQGGSGGSGLVIVRWSVA